MNTTLPIHPGELVSNVGETMSRGKEQARHLVDAAEEQARHLVDAAEGQARHLVDAAEGQARHLVDAAEEHLPDRAVDWTLEHVPGLTTRRRARHTRLRLAAIAAVVVLVAVGWWLHRRSGSDVSNHLAAEPARDPDQRPVSPLADAVAV